MPQDYISENFELAKKESFKPEYKVYQPNPMLMVYDNMTNIWQSRFLKAYQAKIQPSDPDTYTVRFSLEEFISTMDISQAPSVRRLKEIARSVRTVGFDFYEYRRKYGEEKLDPMLIKEVNLFEYFSIEGNEKDGYFVEAMPTNSMKALLKQIAELGYVNYEVKNVLNFSSNRTIRFYEFLKRSEGKTITPKIEELKSFLGIPKEQYPEPKIFTRNVVKKGVDEINAETDISVTFSPIAGRGKGGKTIAYKFTIKPKENKLPIVVKTEPEELAAMSEALDQPSDEEVTTFEKDLFDIIPEEVHEGKIARVRTIKEIVNDFVDISFIDYLELEKEKNPTKDYMQNLAEATRQCNDDRNEMIYSYLDNFNRKKYNVIRELKKSSYYGLYTAALRNWLKEQVI